MGENPSRYWKIRILYRVLQEISEQDLMSYKNETGLVLDPQHPVSPLTCV